jgi:hypothetical protein
MQIDTEHLHYWMQAIRQSPDPLRTLDAFWKGQINSKEWLIKNLNPFIKKYVTIDIHGGWVGVLSSMLFQANIPIKSIRSIDIDPSCAAVATMMNKGEEIQGRFSAITEDMCNIESSADIIINTSCEHITQEQYNIWLSKTSANSLLVLQSNNYQIDEHVRIAKSLEEFKQQSNIDVMWEGSLELPLYTRWMIIGKHNESVSK